MPKIIEKFAEMLKKDRKDNIRRPKHIAITTDGKVEWAKRNKKSIEESLKLSFSRINEIIEEQIKLNIPILTIHIFSSKTTKQDYFPAMTDALVEYLAKLSESDLINKNRVRFYVLGKWYDLPGRVVEPIKELIKKTAENEEFFVNLCINYDGQEEILDAVKMIARQIKAEKIDVEAITEQDIKENLYSSYFLPPDIMIKNGLKEIPNFLVWDMPDASIVFSGKLWPDFEKSDFVKIFENFGKW